MKRTSDDLNADSIDTKNGDVKITDNKKRKKVKFEKNLYNKPTDKNIKTLPVKKNLKEKNLKSEKDNAIIEKTDWLKLKKEKKELREKRRAKKLNNDTIYNKIIQAKQISEKLRRSDCAPKDRINLTHTLHKILETHYNNIIFMHDMSRVVQYMLKYCEANIRQAIFHEIKPSITLMLQSKYAKNCIKEILKRGTREIRSEIISMFYGNIIKLMSHTVSAPLIELAYSTWCTDLEKIYMKQEFYGDIYKQAKDKAVKSLSDVFENAKDMKTATLSAVKANLIRILNKDFINSTLLHTILWEFFCVCTEEDRSELIVILRSFIATLSRTKMGAKVAAQCIWHGNNKDRKVIMKALKENVKAISISEHGYMILLALFDSADDTVIMKKIILSELQEDLVGIALNEYGKHVILYLVARRDSHYFPPSVIEYLRQGDNNSISKKPTDIREKELLETIRDPLLDSITMDPTTWLSNGAIAMVTLAILKVGSGEKLNSAFESIAKFVSSVNSKIKEGDTEYSLVEHAGLHMMLKKLIQNDKELLKRNETTFGEILISHLTAEALQKWTEFNRACFLLIFLIENESESVASTLLSKLKPLAKNLKSRTDSGTSILLKKLKEQKIHRKYNV